MARKDKNRAPDATGEPGSTRITPVDIQQKEFRESFRGYNEREVDQFLDLVTEELARLHAENKRLQEQVEFRQTVPLGSASAAAEEILRRAKAEAERIVARAASAGPTPTGNPPSVNTTADPGAIEMINRFLAREREFLQSLGAKIQDHIESVREDVRALKESRSVEAEEAEDDQGPGPAASPEEGSRSFTPPQGMTRAMAPVRDDVEHGGEERSEDPVTAEGESDPAGPIGSVGGSEASSGPGARVDPDVDHPSVSRATPSDPDPGGAERSEPGSSPSTSTTSLGTYGGRAVPSVAMPSPEEDTGQERSLRELFWGED